MYLKQLAAFGMSAVMVLSGGVMASGAETKTTVDTVPPKNIPPLWRSWPPTA